MPYGPRSARTVPLPKDWPARVAKVLKRDRVCQWPISYIPGDICGTAYGLEVDHIGDPADHDLTNLRALCGPHHHARSSSQGGTAAAARRASRRRPGRPHPGLAS